MGAGAQGEQEALRQVLLHEDWPTRSGPLIRDRWFVQELQSELESLLRLPHDQSEPQEPLSELEEGETSY